MNTTQSTTRAAFNAALMSVAAPALVGAYDAKRGHSNQAHDRYTADGDIAEYHEGYNETRRAMLNESEFRVLTPTQMREEAEDYEWDMYDRERHARGAW